MDVSEFAITQHVIFLNDFITKVSSNLTFRFEENTREIWRNRTALLEYDYPKQTRLAKFENPKRVD